MYVAKMRKINIFIKITTLIALFFVCICSNIKYSYSKDLFNTKNYSTIGTNRSVTIEKINKFFLVQTFIGYLTVLTAERLRM